MATNNNSLVDMKSIVFKIGRNKDGIFRALSYQ